MHAYIFVGALLAVLTTAPLAWKWRLGVVRTACVIALLALVAGTIIAASDNRLPTQGAVRAGLVWFVALAAGFAILAYRFYRDPEREVSERAGAIVSPADGEVIYIREARKEILPVSSKQGSNYSLRELTKTPLHAADAVVIGIGMSFLDVHVNRAPIAGRIIFQRHFPGLFGSLRLPEMVFENERVTTVIDGDGLQIAMVQIASRLVRQITSFVQVGQTVALGQRVGVIRFGSQVDLILPIRNELRINVAVGERVRAGETVLAFFNSALLLETKMPLASAGISQA
jgi:phosphatidylserine decarboxylase